MKTNATKTFNLLLSGMLLVCATGSALANSTNLSAFQSRYISTTEDAGCQICHTVAPTFNPYGLTISMLSGGIATRLQNAESQDSDGQGDSNIDEINSGTQPGWLTGASGAPAGTLDPQDPTAEANGPYVGTNLTVSFTASGSSDPDPDGSIANYSWNFGDGTSGTGSNPSHTYSAFASYTVTLTVTDNIGATATDTASVTISEPVLAKILLVDNDDNSPNVRTSYTQPLDAIGLAYQVWDVASAGLPNAASLSLYDHVIWYTGDKASSVGPDAAGEAALTIYLDNGGNLFLSSQDYHFSRGLTSFMQAYLGVQSVTNDVKFQTNATGVGLYSGTIANNLLLSYPVGFSNYSDVVQPNSTASVVFSGNKGNMGILKRTSAYSAMYWGFPFESLFALSDRTALLLSFLGNRPLKDVLLVDDDNNLSNSPNVLGVYQSTLDALGYSYAVWDKKELGSGPKIPTLRQFKDIIWFTGASELVGAVGPSAQDEVSLATYLDERGRLFLSSQDYAFGRNGIVSPFFKQTFGISAFQEDRSYVGVLSKGEFNSVGSFGIDFPFNNFSDEFTPDGTSDVIMESALSATSGPTGVLKRTNKYLAVYLGFPFEGIVGNANKRNLMRTYLKAEIDDSICFPIVSTNGITVVCL